jgi:hypothetical protein
MNRIIFTLLFIAGLAGCSQHERKSVIAQEGTGATKTIKVSQQPVPQATERDEVPEENSHTAAQMQRCQAELQALQKIDGKRYAERKTEFGRLMAGAALYAGVRGAVQAQTQEAVDSLYKFRADKLCADIGQDVLHGLVQKGGA